MTPYNVLGNGVTKGAVLVTGHTGFKGAWLTMLLHRLGYEVVGLSLPPAKDALYSRLQPSDRPKIEYFIDINERDSVQSAICKHEFKYAFHLAAQPLVLESYINPQQTFATNVTGTVNVLSALMLQRNLEAIGVVTTDKVYKNLNTGKRFTEKDPLGGKDPYSASKVGTEAVADAWRQISAMNNGPRVISLRAGNVIGGGDYSNDRLLPDIVRSYLTGSKLKIRNLNSTRPWQHVLDPLIGYVLALENSAKNACDAFNFGPSETSLSVDSVVKLAVRSWGEDLNYETSESGTDIEAKSLELDSSLAAHTLEWKPFLDQGQAVQHTVNWWKLAKLEKIPESELCGLEIDKALKFNQ
jgi:CDP-glucose 4,6-dehydratase